MASVQELLLAAQSKAKRSSIAPLLDLLDTGIQGYQTGQGIAQGNQRIRENHVDIATKLLQLEEAKKDAIYLEESRQKEKEEEIKRGLTEAGSKRNPVFPREKVTKAFDERGRMSKKVEIVEPSLEDRLGAEIDSGRMSIREAYDLKNRSGAVSPSLLYTMEKDKAKAASDMKSRVIPGYEQTGEVDLDDASVRKLREGAASFEVFQQDLNRYRELIKKHGTSEITNPKVQGTMKALAKSLQLRIKKIAELGVLSGSDIPFIETPIPGPGYLKRVEGTLAALDTTEQSMKSTIDTNLKLGGYARAGITENPDSSITSNSVPVGTVEDGYRFKGGDPSNPSNWEKI